MNREYAENLSKKVVEILKQKRIEQGISKLEISKQTGISRTAITLIESYKNSPTLRTLFMLSSSINVKLEDIIQNAEESLDE
jgi:transcriptional regulator with XRE-family HTH domain